MMSHVNILSLSSRYIVRDPLLSSLTWPSVLPSGWSMEWEPSSTSNDLEE